MPNVIVFCKDTILYDNERSISYVRIEWFCIFVEHCTDLKFYELNIFSLNLRIILVYKKTNNGKLRYKLSVKEEFIWAYSQENYLPIQKSPHIHGVT